MRRPPPLERLRATASAALLVQIWLHVPFSAILALVLGQGWMAPVAVALALAVAATLAWWRDRAGLPTRLTVGLALVGMASLVLGQLHGHPLQLDAHMYFFAALAVLASYCDWRVLIAATVATALHHLVLNFAMPALVYPGGANLGRVFLHAVVLVSEASVLVWLTHSFETMIGVSTAAIEAAVKARHAEAEAHAERSATKARAAAEQQAATDALAQRFEAEVGGLVAQSASAAQAVSGIADTLSGTAGETARRTTAIMAASRETSQGVQGVALATESLSVSVRDIAGHVARAAAIAGGAIRQTESTQGAVKALAIKSERIGEVVTLVRGIARQTNLLALNATIEAARVGVAGKGFSVVAGEVKALAAQTARATEDIQSHVEAIQAGTDEALSAIGGIAETIVELGDLTASVAVSVEQQGRATQQIAQSAQRAAQSSETVAQNIDALGESTGRTGSAAVESQVAAGRLSTQCADTADLVLAFVERIRAA